MKPLSPEAPGYIFTHSLDEIALLDSTLSEVVKEQPPYSLNHTLAQEFAKDVRANVIGVQAEQLSPYIRITPNKLQFAAAACERVIERTPRIARRHRQKRTLARTMLTEIKSEQERFQESLHSS